MANKPKCRFANTKYYNTNSKPLADMPLPIDLSKEMTSIFDLKSRKQERISDYMCRNIRKTKLRALQRMAKIDVDPSVRRPITSKDFRIFSENCPITDMSRFLEKSIRQKVFARGLEKCFPHLLDDIMKDTKLEFRKITHYAGVNLKIKDKYPEDFSVKNYKLLGKTENYEKFLCIRKQFGMRWILHYDIMRTFLKECVLGLPYELFKIEIEKLIDIDDLQYIFREKVQFSAALLHNFHKSMCALFDKSDASFKKRPSRFLPACTGIFSIYVSRSIAHTMESVVKFTESVDISPYLKLYVDFDSCLVLIPTEEQVIEMFHKLLDDVINVGQELYVMEKDRIKGYESKTICLCLTEEFIQKCKKQIADNISQLYKPIIKYLAKIGSEFAEIYSDINSDNLFHNIDILFEDGCQKIQYYKKYIRNVAYIPDNEYFKMGQLDLTNYREKLHDGLRMISDSIFKNLFSQHLWEVNDICDSFQLIKVRATQKPLTTEELIEIGKFMAWVRNEQLDYLNERVDASLKSLCNIITLGLLDEEHMLINSAAMNWIEDILPIIEQHLITYEQLKFEAEEKLQKVIEDINILITDMYPLLVILDEMDNIKLARKYLSKITLHMTKIKEIQLRIEWINNEEVCLSFPKSSYAEFENLKDYVYPFYHLLKLSLDVQKHVSVWQYGQFDLLDYTSANETVEKCCRELGELQKKYRKKLRQAQDENLPIRFRGTVDDPDILNWPAPLKLCGITMNILEDFKPSLTVMRIMCNDALRPRHWKSMSEIAGFNLMPNAGTTLKKMMEFDLKDKLNEYEIISTCATKEQELLDHLNSLKAQWKNVDFVMNEIEENVWIVTRLDDIQTTVDEHIIKILSMRSSVFVKPYEADVLNFYETILKISSVINNWIILQNAYLNLFPIFSLDDVIKHIPNEKKCFEECDLVFKKYVNIIIEQSRVIDVISKTEIVEDLKKSLITLEEVQKGIITYLEIIRLRCPRLYLISNEELINCIALNGDFSDQAFLVKIFPGIKHLKCDQKGQVTSLQSPYNEEVVLKNPINLLSIRNLDQILNNLQTEMLNTVKDKTADCYKIFRKTAIKELVKKYPQQSLQLMARVFWTDQVENALKLKHNIKLLISKRKLEENIEEKIKIIDKNKISHLERIVLKNLLLTDLNNKYLLDYFVKDGLVIDDTHFNWQMQIRYYFQKSLCSMKVLTHSLDYSYEYLGNSEHIILTPLTDRCIVTLLNAYFFNFFGLLKGQSQTGKSVTIRSLAEALGKLFFSFSCISKLSAKALLQIVTGTLLCGSWLCLKNINQLKPEVLSVISQELLSILECKKTKSKEISFDGVTLPFNNTCFILVQLPMENSIKIQLPENVKVMFRTFTLCQPDLEVIIEGLLACKGVSDFKFYSKKMLQCFTLLEDVLCCQKQYIFKLRQVKLVLAAFEKNKSLNPSQNYFTVFCQSFREVFLPSLLDNHHKVLESALSDIFQECYLVGQCAENEEIKDILKALSSELNLPMDRIYVHKVIEVYNCLQSGHNTILLGDTYTAKTTVLKLCVQLFIKLNNTKVSLHIINPKCIDYKDLVGEISTNKNIRWTDGVLLKILKESHNNGEVVSKNWILFDGYMDKTWTKDFLSVLEDGKLFLESLEMFMCGEDITLIFESTNLDNCSPSVVSRCTTIYFPQTTLHNVPLIDAWLNTCQSDWIIDNKIQIEALFKWVIPPCLEAIQVLNLEKYCELDNNIIVKNILTYFQLILDDVSSKVNKKDEDLKNMAAWIHATFIQAGIYALSSFLSYQSRQKFDEFYKHLWKGQNQAYPYPKELERLEVGVPSDGMLFDYCYLYKQRGTWKLWADLLKNEKIIDTHSFYIIPTVDTMRCNFLLDLHIKYNKHFLIIGPKSTGKSLAFKDCYINRLTETDFEKALITVNKHLTANALQKLLLSKLTKSKSGYYSASSDKRFICFLDDLHYSLRDEYNISSSIELVRQHLDHNTWYDSKSFKTIFLERVSFMAATGLVRDNSLPKRFFRHFNVFGITEFNQDSISKIYSQNLMQAWKKSGFPSDMLTAVNQIVNASLSIFSDIQQNMKATLSKCHYIFDMTSLTRVIHGCTFLKKETYDANKKIHIKLWVHEIFRVFADRFYIEDIKSLTKYVQTALVEHFSEEVTDVFIDCCQIAHLFFGTFQDKDLDIGHRHYEEVNFQYLWDMCVQYLHDHNDKSLIKLDLIFFNYALEKLARVCRLLSMPNENGLLLGVTGCGRQSLTKFASFLYKHEFYQPMITRNYDKKTWNDEFKHVLKLCGGLNKKCVFLATEDQLINEGFFEIINYYIRDGEITDLYDVDEKRDILELSRLAAQGGNRNLDISSHKVFLHFNQKCRENFHLFLSLNSTADNLRRRILTYPSLATRFNIILWKDWPDTALRYVANHLINETNLADEIKGNTISAAIFFHRSCQKEEIMSKFVTPKAYIHLNKLFVDLIAKKQETLTMKKNRFQQGLAKLSYAATQIFNMQKALAEYQPLLEEMTKNAIEMTEQIALESIEVEKASALVRKDEKIASEQAVVAQVLKSECEAELAQAIPILEDAISALNTLKPSDITLVKSMKNPPDAIKLVMASVCVIKDVKPDRIPDPSTGRKTIDYWGPSKRILGDMNFLQTLKDFDKDHIKPEIMVKIRKEYLPHKDFKPHVVAKASSAAEGLCKWIIAMDMYDRVAKEVAPKKEKLNKAEREYADTMLILNEKKEEVVRIEEKLAQLNELLAEATKKQLKLQVEVDLCNKKLNSAQKLIGSLSGERLKWTNASENLQKHFDVLAGDLLLSSAIIAYLPLLDGESRNKMLTKWQEFVQENNIPGTKDFNFSSVLSNDVETDHWREYGLPSDSFFIDNAVIFNHSKYFCLLLDPHGQALQWILNIEAGSNIIVTKFTFDGWLADLKYCISQGKPIIIKDTKGYIPPCLNSLIYKQSFSRNGELLLSLDGEYIKIHKHTRVYIVACKPNACYSMDLRSRLTIINFSVTSKSLRDDVLKIVVEIEKPEIQKLSKELAKRNRENKSELKELEIKILNTLCESEADILEDEESILILDESKVLTKIAMAKQEKTKEIARVINDFRQKYTIVAKHVACLFFCINDLQKLHHIYQFSLKWFKNIYFMSILNAGKSRDLNTRCQNLCDTFTFDLYKNINKGLFEKDKLFYTFWLAISVSVSRNDVTNEDVLIFFLLGDLCGVKEEANKPNWISNKMWFKLHKLEQLPTFEGIVKSVADNSIYWEHYMKSTSEKLPNNWNTINDFERLILIQVLKPEKLYDEIMTFIKTVLGEQFLLSMFFDMQEIYNESYSLSPVLFILTSGLDVLNILHNFAGAKQVLHKFNHVSLDTGTLEKGEQLIQQGQREGRWILLQNCHFTNDWLFRLEQNLEHMNFENTNENFRLFLTANEDHEFPLELIQNSIKIIDEPPGNLRKNLLKIYNKPPIIIDDYFYGCPGQQEYFSKLLYGLCHFHVLLQERQNILNWNILYKFEQSDLLLSLDLLRHFVNEQTCLYEKVYYLVGECNYNGFLENDWEKSFIIEMLEDCINDKIFEKNSVDFNKAKQYRLPTKNDRRDYLNHIDKLPGQDPPEVLYLTEYELLAHNGAKIKNFLDLGLQIIRNGDECLLNKDESKILVIIEDLLGFLPEKVFIKKGTDFDEYIIREIRLYDKLLNIIITTLQNLRSAFRGDRGLSELLQEISLNLSQNKVPQIWLQFCYPTLLNLSNFAKSISKNVSFFQNYAQNNNNRFLLRAFFFPRAIITYMKLKFARKCAASVTNIGFEYKTEVNGSILDATEYSIILDELYILGASYDSIEFQIVDLLPKTCYSSLPPIIIKPISITQASQMTPNNYKCCIFKTQAFLQTSDHLFMPRTQNFITYIYLKCCNNIHFWVKRGVSIVCEMNQQTAEELFNMSSPEVSRLEDQVAHELLEKSMMEPDERVYAKSQYIQQIEKQQMMQTPAGMEPVIQLTYSEKRVERDEMAEKVVKNLAITDMDECSGHGTRVTISEQQLDPDYGLSSDGKDIITVKETVSVTPSYTSTARDVIHEVITPKLDIDPEELAKMVEEENQDVENTLRMVPPDLTLQEDKYAAKKRLQKLRLNTESMILLEESVVNPTPTADEALTDTPPEALANIMHTVESGVTPECPPDQVFHTLFEEKTTEHSVILSSIGPGPLQDVIVPQLLSKEIHKESMTPDLTDLTNIYKNVTDAKDWPPVDIFASVMDEDAKSPKQGPKSRPFKALQDEEMPWAEEDLEPLVNIVGAEPAVVLDPANVPDLETSGNLATELSHGIEYFVEADPVQYMSRVQLRGTQPPPWFPGYIFALPEFPDVVKLARSPDEVFISSWKSCQPKIMPDDSISILH